MKSKIVVVIVVVMVLPLGLMAQDHPHGNMNHDNSMSNNDMEVKNFEVGTDFQNQLNGVYQASLELNKAFIAGDATMAKSKAVTMSGKMKSVNMSLLTGDAHMAWMTYMKTINAGLATISQSSDIAEQRDAYAGVSDGLYKSVKAFGVGETVYYQNCPMKKSSWLSNSEQIKNPYYGSMMLTCGSTKEVLN
jgi:membrane fusion protein, copper/silver efflux system